MIVINRWRNYEFVTWRALESQLERSQQRIAELENTRESQISLPILQNQMAAILDASHQVYHGPNTVENFHNFSIESIISELRNHAPDVFQLLQLLGKISDQESEGHTVHDLRPLTAMIVLLKNRAVRLLGVQLLLTFTLIARATNKQVNMLLWVEYIIILCMFTNIMLITMYIVMIFNVGNIDLKPRWGMCVLLDCMEVPTTTCS